MDMTFTSDETSLKQAMNMELYTPQRMGYWEKVNRSESERTILTELVLERMREEKKAVCEYKASLLACVSGEVDGQEEAISTVAHY